MASLLTADSLAGHRLDSFHSFDVATLVDQPVLFLEHAHVDHVRVSGAVAGTNRSCSTLDRDC